MERSCASPAAGDLGQAPAAEPGRAHLAAHGRAPARAGGRERTATRPIPRRGTLGSAREDEQRLDRHLPEIAALIDPRQFEIMTAPHSGVVAFRAAPAAARPPLDCTVWLIWVCFSRSLPAKRMVVVTQGTGLAAYIGQVLPALGLPGVRVVTFDEWAERELRKAIPWIHATLTRDVHPAVTRVKSHPACCTSWSARPRPARASAARARPWNCGPTCSRTAVCCCRCCARCRDAGVRG